MKIHLIHGIHTAEDNNTVAQLIPYLEFSTGLEVVYHRYGYAFALTSRFLNPWRAKKIAKAIKPGDVCVGHSNGACLIWMMAAKYRAQIGGAVLINAALDVDAVFPKCMKFVHVYYNKDDVAVSFAEFFLFAHPWGAMGRDGYVGTDPRVKNFDCQAPAYGFPISGHGHIFHPENLRYWGNLIAVGIKEAIHG